MKREMERNRAVSDLVRYALQCGLADAEEKAYMTNRLLGVLQVEEYDEPEEPGGELPPLDEILKVLLEDAAARGLLQENTVTYRDLYDTGLMDCLIPRPGEVIRTFWKEYNRQDAVAGAKAATGYFYKLCQDADYIRRCRIKRDRRWKTASAYGELDISINLSKPEKDPKAIAAAKTMKQSGYPKCQLCRENEGYAGRVNHPARQNLRMIPMMIRGEEWFLQYSPYVYYNEHCIVLKGRHDPMQIDRQTFEKLFDFIKIIPHYFLGSNADLPIVGGSILTHDHFQGGNYEFAMAKAEIEERVSIPGYEDVEAGIVKWPMSVVRIRHRDAGRLIDLGDHILHTWRGYTDEEAFIFAETAGEPHNTITPIARKRDGVFELDLVLRNNITTEEHPLGVFHPHSALHHIKRENIGLIEVMGLAILPARLTEELDGLKVCLLQEKSRQEKLEDIRNNPALEKHADWVEAFLPGYETVTKENLDVILEEEIGKVFVKVLEDAGVYKWTEAGQDAFRRFLGIL